jgi:hypothetical protein
MEELLSDDVLTAVQGLVPIAADLGISMAQLAIAWVLQQPGITSAIIGATKPEQVLDNVGAVNVTLDAQTLERIDQVLAGVFRRDSADTVSPEVRP